jgi:hypothetical protein
MATGLKYCRLKKLDLSLLNNYSKRLLIITYKAKTTNKNAEFYMLPVKILQNRNEAFFFFSSFASIVPSGTECW